MDADTTQVCVELLITSQALFCDWLLYDMVKVIGQL